MNHRVCILGASGFVGSYLLELIADSVDVTILTRNLGSPTAGSNFRWSYCDLLEPNSLEGVFKDADVVVNLVYNRNYSGDENVRMMVNLAEACRRSNVKRVVHVSTALVAGKKGLGFIDEDVECTPTCDYEISKVNIESILESLRPMTEVVILRPTIVFGIGGINLKDFAKTLSQESSLKGTLRAAIVGNAPLNLVPVQTVAASIMFFLRMDAPCNGIYFVSQDDDPNNNLAGVDEIVSRRMGLKRYFRGKLPHGFVRTSILKWMAIEIDDRPLYSNAKIRALGFNGFHDLRTAVGDYCAEVMSARGESVLSTESAK